MVRIWMRRKGRDTVVLGINNRTENWKTAREFAPLFRDAEARKRLVRRLDETDDSEASAIHLELFWKGTRDYLHGNSEDEVEKSRASLLEHCAPMLPDIRCRILTSKKFRSLKDDNYALLPSPESNKRLLDNLYNTEIDIVLETPKSLFIGEAKHEATFGADGDLVLVHQLIRQYVMAEVLLKTIGSGKHVIPFVVGDKVDSIKNTHQVRFMIAQGWMKERNVLDWKEVTAERTCSAG